jgi:Tfp pilus assembly pilus retraction ATPase PilT
VTQGDDLDALVTELNAGAPQPPAADDQTARLRGWLEQMVERAASDLLLVAGAPPSVRVDGAVAVLDSASGGSLGSEEIEDAVSPTVDALSRLPRGLVLVGGPPGSGKTTTPAALVNEINCREARHIITIEDPIEYEHQHRRSLVEQVEIGIDAPDFPTALRAALRQAPDVIVVGEMRDPETMQIAVAAGETGHLVFSSLHTTDVATTIARIADSFPLERQTITRKHGSFTLEESLAELVRQGLVDRKDAVARAGHPEELDRLLT